MHAFFTKQFKIDGQANFNHQQISFLNFNVLASQNAIGKIQYYIVTRVIKSLLWCYQFETDTESCTFSRSILFSRNFYESLHCILYMLNIVFEDNILKLEEHDTIEV